MFEKETYLSYEEMMELCSTKLSEIANISAFCREYNLNANIVFKIKNKSTSSLKYTPTIKKVLRCLGYNVSDETYHKFSDE